MKIFFTLMLLIGSLPVNAALLDFSFSGNFSHDDDVQLFNFTIGSVSDVTLRTWSYAGGTDTNGNIIPAGGFDPYLTLFDSTGLLITDNDDDFTDIVAADPITGEFLDSLLTVNSLTSGQYIVALTQSANFAFGPNLSDGFVGSDTTGFVDITGSVRTSSWAIDISGVDNAAVVPVPAAIWLFCSGLVSLFVTRKK